MTGEERGFVYILHSYKEPFFLIGMALGLGMTVLLGGNTLYKWDEPSVDPVPLS